MESHDLKRLLAGDSLALAADRLKRSRIRQGISIRTLAAETGISRNSIVRLEQGKGSHPDTVRKVAAALGLHLAGLVKPDEGGGAAIHRLSQDRWFPITDFESHPLADRPMASEERLEFAHYKALLGLLESRLPQGRLIPNLIEAHAPTEPRSHRGEEFAFVLSGRARITVGSEVYDLQAGESIAFWSSEPHIYAPAPDTFGPAVILSVRIDDAPASLR